MMGQTHHPCRRGHLLRRRAVCRAILPTMLLNLGEGWVPLQAINLKLSMTKDVRASLLGKPGWWLGEESRRG